MVSAGLVLGATALELEAEGVLNDVPLSLPSRYCFLLVSKSGSFKYSSNACVNPVGAYRLASGDKRFITCLTLGICNRMACSRALASDRYSITSFVLSTKVLYIRNALSASVLDISK